MTNSPSGALPLSYILPVRHDTYAPDDDLAHYLEWLTRIAEVIVVDGSPDSVVAAHRRAWPHVTHVKPVLITPNGKVGGVLTGAALARHDALVIADDDVRYDEQGLRRMLNVLGHADVVRPQNYFRPVPWHALWDTSRSLLNRLTGGDWPGTLGVRRSTLLHAGGYDGSVLFENLELVRTVRAAGGREAMPLDLYVARRPPTTCRFWSQRVRQAYDEFARPGRCLAWLTLLPLLIVLTLRRAWRTLILVAAAGYGAAEGGRRRAGGSAVFPAGAALFAPAWLLERSVCIWLALGMRVFAGGIRYRGVTIERPATPSRELQRRVAARSSGSRHVMPAHAIMSHSVVV